MDIKLPLNANIQMAFNKVGVDGLNLKTGQLLEAKVIETQVLLNTLSIKVADKTLIVQADRPLNLQSGQSLQLQVVKLLPQVEFKIALPTTESSAQTLSPSAQLPGDTPTLKLIHPVLTPSPAIHPRFFLSSLQTGEQLQARIVNISDNKITLQLLPEFTNSLPPQSQAQTPIQTPVQTPGQTPVQTPIQTLTLTQTTIQTPVQTPGQTPVQTPGQTPVQTPVQTLGQTPVQTPVQTPGQTPIQTPVQTPSQTPIQTPVQTPDQTLTQTNIQPATILITLDAKQLLLPPPSNQNSALASTSPPPLHMLELGSQITLQVIKTGPSPTFTVLPMSMDSEQKINEALKHLLPIQASPTVLLNHLQLALPQLQADTSVAETLKNLARLILQTTPNKTQLTEATQLKQTVNESGLFLETKLAESLAGKPEITFQDDFKLKLGKLIQLLTQEMTTQPENKSSADTEILKQSLQKAQSAVAKLTLDQLQSLPRDESPKQCWTLELPFFNNQTAESVKIEIEQDKANTADKAQKNWAVSITITPPDLATIHCKISCYDGSVNTRFWSEAADTVEKINAHLDYLKQQFELKGLTSGFMHAHQGLPAPSDNSIINTPMQPLLSEKA